jgi:hypothetical protein
MVAQAGLPHINPNRRTNTPAKNLLRETLTVSHPMTVIYVYHDKMKFII